MMQTTRRLFLAVALFATLASAAGPGDWIMFVGTFTRAPSQGIYAFRFHSATGKAEPLGLAAETENPSFLAIHPNQRFLYAVNEVNKYEGQAAGAVSAFAIDAATGKLKLLNRVSSRGTGPCHLDLDRAGKWLYVANYAGGSVAAYPVHDDGTLGESTAFFQHSGSSVTPQRQAAPHAHMTLPSPDGRVLVADLGLDQVLVYKPDAAKGLAPDPAVVKIAPGSGPRHLAFRPDGKFVYLLNEISSTVNLFRYSAGAMEQLQTISTLPGGFSGNNSTAEIVVHPRSPFLYASNRGHNSIAVFLMNRQTGILLPVEHVPTQGKNPRNFALDPSGAFLLAANQDSANVVEFRIDTKTGKLTPNGTVLEVPFPVCLVFAKAQ